MKKLGQFGFKPTEPNMCVCAAIVNYVSLYSDLDHIVDKEMLYQRYLHSPFTTKNKGTDIKLFPAQVEEVTKGVYSAVLLTPENIIIDGEEETILAKLCKSHNEHARQALRDFEEEKTRKTISGEEFDKFIGRLYTAEDRAYILATQRIENGIYVSKYIEKNNLHAVCVLRSQGWRYEIIVESEGDCYELEYEDNILPLATLEITQQKPLDEICRERFSHETQQLTL